MMSIAGRGAEAGPPVSSASLIFQTPVAQDVIEFCDLESLEALSQVSQGCRGRVYVWIESEQNDHEPGAVHARLGQLVLREMLHERRLNLVRDESREFFAAAQQQEMQGIDHPDMLAFQGLVAKPGQLSRDFPSGDRLYQVVLPTLILHGSDLASARAVVKLVARKGMGRICSLFKGEVLDGRERSILRLNQFIDFILREPALSGQLNQKDIDYLLHWAMRNGQEELILRLLSFSQDCFFSERQERDMPLMTTYAMQHGQEDVLEVLNEMSSPGPLEKKEAVSCIRYDLYCRYATQLDGLSPIDARRSYLCEAVLQAVREKRSLLAQDVLLKLEEETDAFTLQVVFNTAVSVRHREIMQACLAKGDLTKQMLTDMHRGNQQIFVTLMRKCLQLGATQEIKDYVKELLGPAFFSKSLLLLDSDEISLRLYLNNNWLVCQITDKFRWLFDYLELQNIQIIVLFGVIMLVCQAVT